MNISKCGVLFSSLLLLLSLTPASQAQIDDATRKLAHDIFKQLIEINTTDAMGNVTTASEAMEQRFRDAGFAGSDIQILGPNDRKKNLVVRLHGTGKHKPLLLIGHLVVVEARREDWTTDPFTFVEKDGFYYGRGTHDMKSGDAIMATTLMRFKKEGFAPDRDIVLALTADEEGGKSNGVGWLLKNHRDLVDAEIVFNHDGGGIQRAEANVNCRILPGHSAEEVRQKLIELFADPTITVRWVDSSGSVFDTAASSRTSFLPPPLRRDVFGPLEKITEEMWPGTPVIPDMATGASDGVYTMAAGLPTYGISGIAIDRSDIRAHGRDERLGIDSYYKGVDFYYHFLKTVTSE